MKKKVFFSLFVAMLLSFGMMAKSNHTISKSKHDAVKKHSPVAKKNVSKVFTCIRATLSCGISGWACGETLMDCIDNAIWADGQLCG